MPDELDGDNRFSNLQGKVVHNLLITYDMSPSSPKRALLVKVSVVLSALTLLLTGFSAKANLETDIIGLFRQLDFASAKLARQWTDQVSEIALRESGMQMRPEQLVLAYDIMLIRARARVANVNEEPQILWIRADKATGVTTLLDWLSKFSEQDSTSHVFKIEFDWNIVGSESAATSQILEQAQGKELVVFDNITRDGSLLNTLVREFSQRPPDGSNIIFIDQYNMYERLSITARTRLQVIDSRDANLCNKAVK